MKPTLALVAVLAAACKDPTTPLDTGTTPVDVDEDGFTAAEDCDDASAAVNPGAAEVAYNAADDDCDPSTPDDDLDGDGFALADDCADDDAAVFPGAPEVAGDGLDNDCDPTSCAATGWEDVAVEWSLPAGVGPAVDDWMDSTFEFGGCSPDLFLAFTTDLTGDRQQDLVVTNNCDVGDVGEDRWLVFAGTGVGFAADPISWPLPVTTASSLGDWLGSPSVSSSAPCATSQFNASVADLDGDGRTDLVVTDDCDAGGVGADHWQVYHNEGDGFAASPVEWSLPAPLTTAPEWLDVLSKFPSPAGCAQGEFGAFTADYTADGIADLVVTDACDTLGVGTDEWQVYPGSATGFAATAFAWNLPPALISVDDWMDAQFEGGTTGCVVGQFTPNVVDLNADRYPDLVVTDLCDDANIGTVYWDVYLGGPTGFADAPTHWTLPETAVSSAPHWAPTLFFTVPTGCATGLFSAAVLDLTADRHPDLVVTDACDDAGVGTDTWLVYPGGAAGFGPAQTWTLPTTSQSSTDDWMDSFQESNAFACGAGLGFTARSFDLTGDRASEFLINDDCDVAGVGTDHWLVFPGTCEP